MSEKEVCAQPLSTAQDLARTLKISIRQFYRLQQQWNTCGRLKEGKHFIRVGMRGKRYFVSAVLDLARRYGY